MTEDPEMNNAPATTVRVIGPFTRPEHASSSSLTVVLVGPFGGGSFYVSEEAYEADMRRQRRKRAFDAVGVASLGFLALMVLL